MLQYIKSYIRLYWRIKCCEGLNGERLSTSVSSLARHDNPKYRAKKGGTWVLMVCGMVPTYEKHQFWIPEEDMVRGDGSAKVLAKEEYREGKLYKRSYLANPHLNNKMVTEYIK